MLDDITLKISFLAGLFLIVSLYVSRYFKLTGDPMLDAIPTVGFSDPILSYISAVQFIFHGVRMLKDGYEKKRPGLFKIAGFRGWMVLATGLELIDDIKRAPDHTLSTAEAKNGTVQPPYTLGVPSTSDPYLTKVVRSKLARDTASIFKEVREELVMAMDELVPTDGDKWITVPIQEIAQQVVFRTTNRIIVGVPLCRDQDYQTLNITCARNVVKFGVIISLFPKPFKRIVSRLLSNVPSQIQQEIEFIRPIFEERSAKMEEYGEDWDDKPNDILMWLMSETQKVKMPVEDLSLRLLLANFASIHTTSTASDDISSTICIMTFVQVFYRLLANPDYIEPLRQEVDAAIREEGWTKAGIDKMHKIDSIIRETQRIDGVSSLALSRIALRPFTFSNGVTVPAGTLVTVPGTAVQTDERTHPKSDEFDGFRFAKLRDSERNTTASRNQTVSASNEHLPWGLGQHTCPGRFLAVSEIKILLAYIVTTYDIKFEEGRVPREFCISYLRIPGNANVMFRARQK
ncbi:cytochrome P450 [Russula emetica]|nr:cytochrome P450 [Russula emetica]